MEISALTFHMQLPTYHYYYYYYCITL